MKRVLMDTNIYGRLIEDPLFLEVFSKVVPHDFVVYGTPLIRKELREIPTSLKIEEKSKRNTALLTYDSFVRKDNHTLQINEFIMLLAHKYFEEYKRQGGSFSLHELLSDFLLVACASLHKLDLVVSDDKRTMLSEKAKIAYSIINENQQFRTPSFYNYNNFKQEVWRVANVSAPNSSV
ncbi:hypothetical protein HZA99_01070 [Candidatus Woesearchaeota archaeon]|nr:hypothetical protein [Candidatus Woesearchaeota archaeon]